MATTDSHADSMSRPDHNPHGYLINRYLRWLTADASPNTVSGYRTVLQKAHRELPNGLPIALTDELRDWIFQDRYQAKTRAMYRSAIISFFAWGVREGIVDYDPAARLPRARQPTKLPRPCTHAQLAAILASAPEPVRTWALIAAYAGCRCHEIAQLRRADISPEWLYIQGKGNRERIVPTHPELWAAVESLPPGLIAGGRTANRVSARARYAFREVVGVDTTMHRLRDWYGTYGYAATSDLRAVQQLMGHSSPRTTAGYIQVADHALRAVVTGLPVVGTRGDGAAGTGG